MTVRGIECSGLVRMATESDRLALRATLTSKRMQAQRSTKRRCPCDVITYATTAKPAHAVANRSL
jgi:hypothetical protein